MAKKVKEVPRPRFMLTNEAGSVLAQCEDESEVRADRDGLANQGYTRAHVYQHIGTFVMARPKPTSTYIRRKK